MKAKNIITGLIAGTLIVGSWSMNWRKADAASQQVMSIRFGESATVETLPGAKADTDTAITNDGNVDAYIFIEVDVPLVRDVDLEKNETAREDGWVPVMKFTPLDGWELMTEEITDGVLTQVYVYGRPLTALKPGEKTQPLFESWHVVNCRVKNGRTGSWSWDEIANLCAQTRVTAFSIQTGAGDDPETAWKQIVK